MGSSVNTTTTVTADDRFIPVPWVQNEFERIEREEGPSSLFGQVRVEALRSIATKGIPTTRLEDWKYTNAQAVANNPHTVAGSKSAAPRAADSSGFTGPALSIVNGRFRPELGLGKLPEGIEAAGLAEALGSASHPLHKVASEYLGSIAGVGDDQIVAFNTALVRDGVVIRVKKGAQVEQPIALLFSSAPAEDNAAIVSRVLIIAEPQSRAEVVEIFTGVSGKDYLASAVTEIFVGENASLTHSKIQNESLKATHFGRVQVRQSRSSRFSSRVFQFGGALVRNEVNPILDGEGIETTLFGLTVISGTQHVDNHTTLDHARPNSQSTEIYKGIYGGKSRGVFCGTIIVRQDAQKTNAIQSNNALLLSDDAEIDSKPQLTIYADDVKCTHGATVGQLDEQALFYLRSRGIDEKTARGILIKAFAEDIVARVEAAELNSLIEGLLVERLDSIL